MIGYISRRLLQSAGAVFGAITITFLLMYILPANPAQMIAGPSASPATVRRISQELGLDQPLTVRYLHYLNDLVHGNLGRSYAQRVTVNSLIASHFPVTFELVLIGIAFELLIGIPIGILSAVRRRGVLDQLFTMFAFTGVSTPQFVTGLILLYALGYLIPLFPLGGYGSGSLQHFVLPGLSLGIAGGGWYARVLRSSLVEVLHQDYIRTAKAKGATPRKVIFHHALRNGLLPVAAMVGMDLGVLMGGVIVVEQVFSLPGIGQMMWQAIQVVDIPVIMGVVIVTAIVVVVGNLIADLIYLFLDPRIQYN